MMDLYCRRAASWRTGALRVQNPPRGLFVSASEDNDVFRLKPRQHLDVSLHHCILSLWRLYDTDS
jgi:hypothetical protein